MAGINRLGRGAAKPGTLRPTDPNRFRTEDFYSLDAEDDPEYLRRVLEVEQLATQKAGCIIARGAFDKADHLYLRDEAEKARHAELELQDSQLSKFAQLRSNLEHGEALAPEGSGPGPPGDAGAAYGTALKRARLPRPVAAVKARKSDGKGPPEASGPSKLSAAAHQERKQEVKRLGGAAAAVQPADVMAAASEPNGSEVRKGSDESHGTVPSAQGGSAPTPVSKPVGNTSLLVPGYDDDSSSDEDRE